MNMAIFTLRAIAEAITTMPYVLILITIGFVLYLRNKNTVAMQRMVIGEYMNSALELTISQIVLGIMGGALGSLMLSYLGVIFDNQITISLLFMLSVILMLFRSRFICFSYSAGILSIVSVVFQIFQRGSNINLSQYDFLKVDVVMVMSLVAVMHIIEGILVFIDGNKGAIPVFSNKDNKIIGGFALKRYWAIPIAVMFLINNPVTADSLNVATPSLWPIVKSSYFKIVATTAIALLPFYGMIGYSAITFTKTKREKAINSGICIGSYGVILLIVAQFARLSLFAQLMVAIFAPLAHEVMLKLQMYYELKGKPKYVSTDDGLMVLEVAPSSPAYEMGIKSGDLLIEVNDKRIFNEQDMIEALNEMSNFIWLKVKTVKGKLLQVDYNKMNTTKRLGIIFVPRIIPKESVVVKYDKNKFKDVLQKAKKKNDDDGKSDK
ncbi:PDZ domain-containing protein [Clostridium akagii]|uniref:PDZ domain-containing protein n=1 Tax=Clostridium akagii TaxID=91623 RepID=UPI00047A5E56|nr:PDZ domain-containing protein [Clostridium akagii]